MVALAQRHLAIERIVKDRGRMAQFSRDQQKDLRAMGAAAELEVRVAITRTYRHLFYPSADAPKRSDGLAYHRMPVQEQGKVSRDQTGILVGVLRELDKVLTGDDGADECPIREGQGLDERAGQLCPPTTCEGSSGSAWGSRCSWTRIS